VFLGYNDIDYINSFFNLIEKETFHKLVKQKNSHKNKTFLEGAMLLKVNKNKVSDDILVIKEMKELNQRYFNKIRTNQIERFGAGVINTLINQVEPVTYVEFKQKIFECLNLQKKLMSNSY
jgi:hypothetical protein